MFHGSQGDTVKLRVAYLCSSSTATSLGRDRRHQTVETKLKQKYSLT